MKKNISNALIILIAIMAISSMVFARRPAVEPISSIAIDQPENSYANAENSPGHHFTAGNPKKLTRTIAGGAATYTPPLFQLRAENQYAHLSQRIPAAESSSNTPGEMALLLLFLAIPYMVWSVVLRRVESDYHQYSSDVLDFNGAKKERQQTEDDNEIPKAS